MSLMRRRGVLGFVAVVISVLIAGSAPVRAQERLKVLATFSILGDFVTAVGGNRVAVSTLVGPNSDAHLYSPAPADARKVADAAVVVSNGLGFEGWFNRLVRASGTRAKFVETTSGMATRKLPDGHADPHGWQSAIQAKTYVANVLDALVAADPPGKADYESNAAAYLAKLDALDREIRAAIADVPPDRRRIVTSHNAFGYFQQAYGIEFIAPQGVSTESEASARDVARIITQVRRDRIPAVFLENVSDP